MVHVQPGASRTELAGRHGDALKIRVREQAREGKANEAVVTFLAATLGIPQRQVTVRSGHLSRRKLIAVTGASEQAVMRLQQSASPNTSGSTTDPRPIASREQHGPCSAPSGR